MLDQFDYTNTYIVYYQHWNGNRVILMKDDSLWSGRRVGHWIRDDGELDESQVVPAGAQLVPQLKESP